MSSPLPTLGRAYQTESRQVLLGLALTLGSFDSDLGPISAARYPNHQLLALNLGKMATGQAQQVR